MFRRNNNSPRRMRKTKRSILRHREKSAKEVSLMRELGRSIASTSLSPGDVTDGEDNPVKQAE